MGNETTELAVVIPVYNEQESIRAVLEKWSSKLDQLSIRYQIHVYNDGSKDNTLAILTQYATRHKRIVIHNKENSGHGPTILLGYRENCDKEWIFQIDSDDEIDPEAFADLWKKRDQYHFLIGRRSSFDTPFIRRFISFISRVIVRIFYGSRVYDVNLPYRLMKSEQFKDLFFALPNNMFAPNIVISGVVSLRKMSVYEIAIQKRLRATDKVRLKKIKLLKAAVKSFFQTIMFRFTLRSRLKSQKHHNF